MTCLFNEHDNVPSVQRLPIIVIAVMGTVNQGLEKL